MADNPVDVALRQKIARGEIELVEPLDFLILDALVPEGTTMSGMYPIGTMLKEVSKKLGVPSSVISGRTRYLMFCGYATKVKALGSGGKHAWQRTAEGDTILNEWRAGKDDGSDA